jgi:hypothetical protein
MLATPIMITITALKLIAVTELMFITRAFSALPVPELMFITFSALPVPELMFITLSALLVLVACGIFQEHKKLEAQFGVIMFGIQLQCSGQYATRAGIPP